MYENTKGVSIRDKTAKSGDWGTNKSVSPSHFTGRLTVGASTVREGEREALLVRGHYSGNPSLAILLAMSLIEQLDREAKLTIDSSFISARGEKLMLYLENEDAIRGEQFGDRN